MKSSFARVLSKAACLMAAGALLSGCLSQLPSPVVGGGSQPGPPVAGPVTDGRHHVVRPGDTLLGISRTYNQSVSDLVSWNNLDNPHQIRVGQRLRIAPPEVSGSGDVAVSSPVDMSTIESSSVAPAEVVVPSLNEPLGGRAPYSDQAWVALNPGAQIEFPSTAEPPLPVPTPEAKSEAPPTPAPPEKESAWLWPAKGAVIESFDDTNNKGLDISGEPGDPVVASAAGNVVYAGSGLRGYGKLVIIKHNDDYLTAYAHNQALLVKEGDAVAKGHKIAELGSTDADRPKLHFEIRRQGRPVDPMQYLPAR